MRKILFCLLFLPAVAFANPPYYDPAIDELNMNGASIESPSGATGQCVSLKENSVNEAADSLGTVALCANDDMGTVSKQWTTQAADSQFPGDMVEGNYIFCEHSLAGTAISRFQHRFTEPATVVDIQARCIPSVDNPDTDDCFVGNITTHKCSTGTNQDYSDCSASIGSRSGFGEFGTTAVALSSAGSVVAGDYVRLDVGACTGCTTYITCVEFTTP